MIISDKEKDTRMPRNGHLVYNIVSDGDFLKPAMLTDKTNVAIPYNKQIVNLLPSLYVHIQHTPTHTHTIIRYTLSLKLSTHNAHTHTHTHTYTPFDYIWYYGTKVHGLKGVRGSQQNVGLNDKLSPY